MAERWYYCTCGCTVHIRNAVKNNNKILENGDNYNGYSCPDHEFGIALCRVTRCLVCGTNVYTDRIGPVRIRCTKHAEEYKVVQAKKYRVYPKKISKAPTKKDILRGDYCIKRNTCGPGHFCIGCTEYDPIFSNVDPGKRLGGEHGIR